jgi:PIN domain nuclease of toxin-antitoxin system
VYLLDTSAFLKAVLSGLDFLPLGARRVMRDEANDLLLSTVSVAELGILGSVTSLSASMSDGELPIRR